MAAVSAGDGFSPFIIIDGVRCGRCGHCDGRPFAGFPDFDKPYGVLYPHVLVGVFKEIFFNLCIGQADAELVGYSLFTLVADLVAVSTLLGEAADFCLPAKAGSECANQFTSVLHHPAKGHPSHLGVFFPDGCARMAFSRFSSVKSSRGKGPTQFRVTSRLNLVSQHSRSCMVVSFAFSWTACEYDLQRVRK